MDVSFQLYSAREMSPWEDVIKMIADLGYTQVEGFGGVYEDLFDSPLAKLALEP